MKDRVRISGGNGRSSKLMCPSDYAPTNFATFLTDFKAGDVYVDVTANNSMGADAGVTEIGTALNKANLLTDATASKYGYEATQNPTVNDIFDYLGGTINRKTSVSLPLANWSGLDSPFTQVITVAGSDENSKVDLQPDATALAQMMDDGVSAIFVENNNNVLTAYAVGAKPTANLTIQATMYEVSV